MRIASLFDALWRRRRVAGRPDDGALCAAAIDAASNPIFVTDATGRFVRVNPAFTRLTGYRMADLVDATPRILKSGRQPEVFYEALWATLRNGDPWRGRLVNRKKGGEIYDVEQSIAPVFGPWGQVTHFVAIHEEIHERLARERRLLHDAMFEPDTDLPNWNLLRRRIADALARGRRSGRALAVMTVSVEAGTEAAALRAVSRRLRASVREVDFVARHEDAFVLVLEGLEHPQLASRPAERLVGTLRDRHVRAGIAVHPGDDASPEVLVQHAAAASRLAQGHGDFRYYHGTL